MDNKPHTIKSCMVSEQVRSTEKTLWTLNESICVCAVMNARTRWKQKSKEAVKRDNSEEREVEIEPEEAEVVERDGCDGVHEELQGGGAGQHFGNIKGCTVHKIRTPFNFTLFWVKT